MADELLINFNSPEKNDTKPCRQSYLKNPLIPGPVGNCNVGNNNPFDEVATNAENWDPFELVLCESLKKFNITPSANGKTPQEKVGKSKRIHRTPSLTEKKSVTEETPHKFVRSHSVTENVKFFRTEGSGDEIDLNESTKSAGGTTRSIRDRIRKVVKRRVSKCIERALNGSISQPDLHTSNSKTNSSISDKFCNDKSRGKVNNDNISQTKEENESVNSCAQDTLKTNCDFQEDIKNVSNAIYNLSMADNQKEAGNTSNEIEDLMSIRPPWEENGDSLLSSDSDDSSIGLPKVKLFYLKKKEKKDKDKISAEEIAQYKKRIRASIDGNMSCDEEIPTSKIEVEPVEVVKNIQPPEKQDNMKVLRKEDPLGVKTVPANVPSILPEDLRPKKTGTVMRKGPMKALMPLQKMTKTLINKVSPMSKLSQTKTRNFKVNENNSFTSNMMCPPVASSTPNSKKSVVQRSGSVTPLVLKTRTTRPSKKEDEKPKSRRSTSLTSDSRSTGAKLPFSVVNNNVKEKSKIPNRPHTAPSNTKQSSLVTKGSPKPKDNSLRKIPTNDKENRMISF